MLTYLVHKSCFIKTCFPDKWTRRPTSLPQLSHRQQILDVIAKQLIEELLAIIVSLQCPCAFEQPLHSLPYPRQLGQHPPYSWDLRYRAKLPRRGPRHRTADWTGAWPTRYSELARTACFWLCSRERSPASAGSRSTRSRPSWSGSTRGTSAARHRRLTWLRAALLSRALRTSWNCLK